MKPEGPGFLKAVQWVSDQLGLGEKHAPGRKVSPCWGSSPSRTATALMRWVQDDPKHESKFWLTFCPKLLPSQVKDKEADARRGEHKGVEFY